MNQKAFQQPLRAKNQVEVKCITWEKDSHGLFDYESSSVSTEKHRVDNACQIVRQDNKQIKIVDYNERIDDDNCKVLACITQKDSVQPSYFINPNNQTNNSDSNTSGTSSTDVLGNKSGKDSANSDAFLIVRFLRNQKGEQKGYPLQVGDMMKIGRVEYCVIEKNTDEAGVQQVNDIFCNQEQYNFNIDSKTTETKTCRICLCEEEQCVENPLLNPCKCKGSCEYMHFDCLKHWVESKVQKKNSHFISTYKWKNLECEVCKHPLPKVININNKRMPLIEVQRPEGSYLILESISREKKVSKGLFIIQNLKEEEDQNQAKIGRGHTCDIRIQDISVSRFHSYIKYENGQFLLFDNNSKFGTLVRLDKNYPILSQKVGIQVGRTVITFSLKLPIQANPLNQVNHNTQQTTVQYDRSYDLQKLKLTPEQQQQIYAMTQQYKSQGSNLNINQNNTAYTNNTGNLRMSTNSNIQIAQTSNIINNVPSSNGGNQQGAQQKTQGSSQQMMTSSQGVLDKLQKANIIKQPKGNAFVSNAAINIIGGNSSQSSNQGVSHLTQGVMNESTRTNIQNIVLSNGSMPNFNTAQHKMNEMNIMNNFQNANNQNGINHNTGMYTSTHLASQNNINRNSSNATHYNEFLNYNQIIQNQGLGFHSVPNTQFTSTLYNSNHNKNQNTNSNQNSNINTQNSGHNHYTNSGQSGQTFIQRNKRNNY